MAFTSVGRFGSDTACPLDQSFRIDILHELMIGWHMFTQGGKTSRMKVAGMGSNRFSLMEDLHHPFCGTNINFLMDQGDKEPNTDAFRIQHGNQYVP